MDSYLEISQELLTKINLWEDKLMNLDPEITGSKRNTQNRNIKQIVGHMIDSASNNTHRVIHLQYQPSPLLFPDYANLGNNDRWIAIQNYEDENWYNLVQLWKYTNLHFCHIIKDVNMEKLNNIWITATKAEVTLDEMIRDYPRHFNLHLAEIDELINK